MLPVDALFSSLCDCVLMNPEEGFLGEDEDEEGEASVTVLGESAAAAPEDLDEVSTARVPLSARGPRRKGADSSPFPFLPPQLLEGDQERFADA